MTGRRRRPKHPPDPDEADDPVAFDALEVDEESTTRAARSAEEAAEEAADVEVVAQVPDDPASFDAAAIEGPSDAAAADLPVVEAQREAPEVSPEVAEVALEVDGEPESDVTTQDVEELELLATWLDLPDETGPTGPAQAAAERPGAPEVEVAPTVPDGPFEGLVVDEEPPIVEAEAQHRPTVDAAEEVADEAPAEPPAPETLVDLPGPPSDALEAPAVQAEEEAPDIEVAQTQVEGALDALAIDDEPPVVEAETEALPTVEAGSETPVDLPLWAAGEADLAEAQAGDQGEVEDEVEADVAEPLPGRWDAFVAELEAEAPATQPPAPEPPEVVAEAAPGARPQETAFDLPEDAPPESPEPPETLDVVVAEPESEPAPLETAIDELDDPPVPIAEAQPSRPVEAAPTTEQDEGALDALEAAWRAARRDEVARLEAWLAAGLEVDQGPEQPVAPTTQPEALSDGEPEVLAEEPLAEPPATVVAMEEELEAPPASVEADAVLPVAPEPIEELAAQALPGEAPEVAVDVPSEPLAQEAAAAPLPAAAPEVEADEADPLPAQWEAFIADLDATETLVVIDAETPEEPAPGPGDEQVIEEPVEEEQVAPEPLELEVAPLEAPDRFDAGTQDVESPLAPTEPQPSEPPADPEPIETATALPAAALDEAGPETWLHPPSPPLVPLADDAGALEAIDHALAEAEGEELRLLAAWLALHTVEERDGTPTPVPATAGGVPRRDDTTLEEATQEASGHAPPELAALETDLEAPAPTARADAHAPSSGPEVATGETPGAALPAELPAGDEELVETPVSASTPAPERPEDVVVHVVDLEQETALIERVLADLAAAGRNDLADLHVALAAVAAQDELPEPIAPGTPPASLEVVAGATPGGLPAEVAVEGPEPTPTPTEAPLAAQLHLLQEALQPVDPDDLAAVQDALDAVAEAMGVLVAAATLLPPSAPELVVQGLTDRDQLELVVMEEALAELSEALAWDSVALPTEAMVEVAGRTELERRVDLDAIVHAPKTLPPVLVEDDEGRRGPLWRRRSPRPEPKPRPRRPRQEEAMLDRAEGRQRTELVWIIAGAIGAFTLAELVTAAWVPFIGADASRLVLAGTWMHVGLAIGLLLAANLWPRYAGGPVGDVLGVLAVLPLVRLSALAIPVETFRFATYLTLLAFPAFIVLFGAIRSANWSLHDLRLGRGARSSGSAILGLLLLSAFAGALEFLILLPVPAAVPGDVRLVPAVAALILMGGLFEALLLRGALQQGLVPVVGDRRAVFLAALVGAAMHVGNQSLVGLALVFGMGLVYGEHVRRGGSLWAIIAAQALLNLMLYIIAPVVLT
ncbi:MAG: type II CAAX prenyl endopeptidase Rce1 family protein [Thermoplasmatota archaeon]